MTFGRDRAAMLTTAAARRGQLSRNAPDAGAVVAVAKVARTTLAEALHLHGFD